MKKGHFAIVCFLAFMGGIIGGLISNWVFQFNYAMAKTKKIPSIIEARQFKVIDDYGKTMGYFGDNGTGCVLSIESKIKNVITAVEISHYGLKAIYDSPDYWKYARTETSIDPWGFKYIEFSKSDPLKKWTVGQEPNISIGDNGGRASGPSIRLYDSQYRLRAALGTIENIEKRSKSVIQRPTSSIVLYGEQGNVIWEIP